MYYSRHRMREQWDRQKEMALIRCGSTTKVLAKCMLKYYRIS